MKKIKNFLIRIIITIIFTIIGFYAIQYIVMCNADRIVDAFIIK